MSLLGTELRFCDCPARGLVAVLGEGKHVVHLRMFEGFWLFGATDKRRGYKAVTEPITSPSARKKFSHPKDGASTSLQKV